MRWKNVATSKRKPVKTVVSEVPQICAKCGDKGDFYSSKSIMNTKWGKILWCKNCLVELFEEIHKKLDDKEKAMIELCKLVNIPYKLDCFKIAKEKFEEDGTDIVRGYFFNFAHARIKPEDTFFDSDIFQFSADGLLSSRDSINPEIISEDGEEPIEKFQGREELENMFGLGFTKKEYIAMKKKYDFLKNNYPGKTSMHQEALTTYVTYKVKQELATAKGDAKEANTWGKLADNAASNAKINPSQLSARDLQGGAGSFSEISEIVEQAIDIIPILPQFKYQPIDAGDFLIWQFANYERDLTGMPLCKYPDVYKFYDERKEDYLKQYGDPYGIYANDPTIKNRKKIEAFISTEAEKEIDDNKDSFENGTD